MFEFQKMSTKNLDNMAHERDQSLLRDHSMQRRAGSVSCTRDQQDYEHRSRSRQIGQRSPRCNASHSDHRSHRRSPSASSVWLLRDREHQLSVEKERLRLLEKEVRRQHVLLKEQGLKRSRLRSPFPRPGPSNRDKNSKKQRLMTMDVFEEFLNLIKSKSGTRESFATINVIPDFDPLSKEQTINVWLDKVDECAEIYDWSDKQTIHYALPKLTGHAKVWYQGLPSIKHTWLEWKIMLKESFPATENYAELLTDMLNRRVRPGESFEVYYFSKINLLNRCKIFGKQAVDCLLYGIDDRGVRVGAQAAKFERTEDVLEFFKSLKTSSRNTLDVKHDVFNREYKRITNDNPISL